MEFKFLGRGSAFNLSEGNTSAYFYSNGELFLIDCGESIFKRIVDSYLLDNIKAVNVLITHTHSDHVGSLGSLILYCFYNLNIKINIILPSKHKYLSDLEDLLRIFGCKSKMYKFIYENELTDKYDLYAELNDGGTKIYKSNKDNATIVVCHTTFGNKDVFIGDYNMQFDNESMCKR